MQRFVDLVCARLTDVGIDDSQLQTLWREVSAERVRPEVAGYRKMEAALGADPDEIPDSLVNRLVQLGGTIGESAVEEIAHAVAGEDQANRFAELMRLACEDGVEGEFQLPWDWEGSEVADLLVGPAKTPWEAGYRLARIVRQSLNCSGGKVSNKILAESLGLAEAAITRPMSSERRFVSLAVRHDQGTKFIFRKPREDARRFEAARFISANMLSKKADLWLPCTDAHSSRQQIQRAFGAELLCPIMELKEFLGRDVSESAMEDAAEHFGVSQFVVKHQLDNESQLFSWPD